MNVSQSSVLGRLLALLIAVSAACNRTGGIEPPPTKDVVHTDLAPVALYVSLPGVVAVRWIESSPVPHGPRDFAPGPSDWALTAYVELDPSVWPALDKQLGGPRESETSKLEEAWAEEILTPHTLAQLPREGEYRVVELREYDIAPIRKGTRTGNRASRIGDGLLMSFSTN